MSESNFSMDNETISEEYNWGFLAFSVLPVLAILGNVLVISSVIWEKTLQTSTNWLIVSLAFADFLVGLIVMPWGIYSLVSLLSLTTYYTKSHYFNVKKN
jgi:hydrogenase-4 membrane subunit HyfE